jgi:hypothetical protein
LMAFYELGWHLNLTHWWFPPIIIFFKNAFLQKNEIRGTLKTITISLKGALLFYTRLRYVSICIKN